MQQTQINSNWKYREYLTKNALSVQKQNMVEALSDIGYDSSYMPRESNMNSTPYSFTSYLDNSRPDGYNSSDLKNAYLQKEQLDSRRFAPTIKGNLPFSKL